MRQGSNAVDATTATAATAIAVRADVAAASTPPAAMQTGWTVLELIDHAMATRVMWVSAVARMREVMKVGLNTN